MKNVNILIFFILFTFSLFGQKADVEIVNIYKDSTETKEVYYNLHLNIKNLNIDSNNLIKLLNAKCTDENGIIHNADLWYIDDYYSRQNNLLDIPTEPTKSEFKTFTKIEGRFKYFTPTIQNNSIVVINKPKEKFNSNILTNRNSLAKAILLNVEEFKKLSTDSLKYKSEVHKIEKKYNIPQNSINKALKVFYKENSFPEADYKKMFVFYCEDENENILKINVLDEFSNCYNGVFGVNNFKRGKLVVINLLKIPNEKSKLEFILEKKDAVKIYNFELKDVIIDKYTNGL
ncbi:hypothetical protein FCR2A7T_29940 [Flavobacterium cauense R2A-7]|uniref:hypothetical protein n=2 Tax=Flavobacterium cauense TaxID=510946 RepID=UPI0003C5CDFF|nr:hypothetical protein [Flavobacterium cauense]ESU18404.1 hypothetical protein FCR2A7T_29940 [Flavobacterium cauense R2A-7]KGO78618.1 hypothetical protein Q762_15085 [Flavobacterium cauense R2A-7]